ncbi:MAG: OmpH family outer membrane protein [Pseudomonadota bacterium]
MRLGSWLTALGIALGSALCVSARAQEQAIEAPLLAEEEQGDEAAEIRDTPPNILVVDFDWVIRQSDAAQSIQSQLDAERQVLQERFAEREAELRAMEQELEAIGDEVSNDEQLARRREFEQLVADTQREAQARRSILDQAFRDAMDQVRSASVLAIADIADSANAEIVLHINQVVIYSRDRNISEQTLAALNEQLPDVQVDIPVQE